MSSQIHKTPFYVQRAIRTYIDENKSFQAQAVEGMAFDELELPCICVVVTSQSTKSCGGGGTGNKIPSVSVVVQTHFSTPESEHWDLWAEVEDLFNKPMRAVLDALNLCTQDVNFQQMEIGDLVNIVDSECRKTLIELTFLTNLIG